MNILFVNHGDFACNSMGHIAGFANELCRRGHACVVASPHSLETAQTLISPLFLPRLYTDVLANPHLFPDGKTAQMVHAWTPRETVRRFVFEHLGKNVGTPVPRLIVHLEDNEEYLTERAVGVPFEELRTKTERELETLMGHELSHPRRYRDFLRLADAITAITERLVDFMPPGMCEGRGAECFQVLTPGVDFRMYAPQASPTAQRQKLGIRPDEKVLSYTGNSHFGNTSEMRNLHLAVQVLNERGTPCRLIRTGAKAEDFVASFAPGAAPFIINLGVVPKNELPGILAMADVLVQPGEDDAFNRYRFPSKIPEFLSMGKPVVLPRSNLAARLREGEEALFLENGSPEEIAEKCLRIFADGELTRKLGENAAAFARTHFDIVKNTDVLESFYQRVHTQKENSAIAQMRGAHSADIAVLAGLVRERLLWRTAGNTDAAALGREIEELLTNIGFEGGELPRVREALRAMSLDLEAVRTELHLTQTALAYSEGALGGKREELAKACADLERMFADLQQREAELGKSRGEAHAALTELDAMRRSLQEMTAKYQAELAWRKSMQESRSWKITRPMRVFGGLFRKD